jgi:subtilisin family serine protease
MKRTMTSSLMAIASAGLLALIPSFTEASAVTAAVSAPASTTTPAAAPGQLLVGYAAGATGAQRVGARAAVQGALLERVVPARADRAEVELVTLPAGMPLEAAIRRLRSQPGVAYAEPNWVVSTGQTTSSDDPLYINGSLWGMYGDATTPANEFGSQAGEAWAAGATGAKAVYVGVIDEGIDVNHPDLDANVWTNPLDLVDGVDNDGNGYIDDVNGWDFHNNDRTVYDGGNADKHGTHVAGTIGAERNGVGVVGAAWDVTLISAKFLGPNGGYTSNAIKAVNYLTDLKTRQKLDIVASNNSWGGGGYSQALHDAIIRGAKANILFIAAAGNDGTNNDTTVRYPSAYNTKIATSTEQIAASYDAVIAVAAITSTGGLASWSNFGATTVDLGAPGAGITSTLPKNSYGTYSGTSMATPHVSGAAVVLAARSDTARGGNLRSALLTTTPTASLTGRTVTGGRLNLSPAVTVVNAAPTASFTTTCTDLSCTFTDASNDTDGTITSWAWTFGDLSTSTAQVPAHTYAAGGTYTVTLTVTDNGGATATATGTVTVTLPAAPAEGPTSAIVKEVQHRLYGGKTNSNNLEISVTVTNNLGTVLSGASVTIDVLRDGAKVASGTATTNTAGVATFTLKNPAKGCYITDVTNVVSGSLTFERTGAYTGICKA